MAIEYKSLSMKMAWSHKNLDKVLKIAAEVRNKAKDEQQLIISNVCHRGKSCSL